MVEITDWIFLAFTGVLAVATTALAWHTARLVKVTKDTSAAVASLQIMPSLTFDASQPLSDGAGIYLRFSIKNVGRGHAKVSEVRARLTSGKELKVMSHSYANVIEADKLFYWDIYGTNPDDEIEISIAYADLQGKPYPIFQHTFTAH